VYFDSNETYTGFDEQSPLARSGGKAVVSQQIIGESGKAVLIGDGVTDLEAKNDRIQFIGFGGVVIRDLVRSQSSDYIEEATLLPLLDRLLPRS
ncbi:MAG: haloacid dehalogenase, partial [Desulfobacterales bacterium]|nr:haloacid dehalogenase [Desulfobacterales bacterium]